MLGSKTEDREFCYGLDDHPPRFHEWISPPPGPLLRLRHRADSIIQWVVFLIETSEPPAVGLPETCLNLRVSN